MYVVEEYIYVCLYILCYACVCVLVRLCKNKLTLNTFRLIAKEHNLKTKTKSKINTKCYYSLGKLKSS